MNKAEYRDGSIAIEGRDKDTIETMMAVAHEYTKTANVYAIEAGADGVIYTPEGPMSFVKGDMIVSDIPPTHAWPVNRAVFDRTYQHVPRAGLDGPRETDG